MLKDDAIIQGLFHATSSPLLRVTSKGCVLFANQAAKNLFADGHGELQTLPEFFIKQLLSIRNKKQKGVLEFEHKNAFYEFEYQFSSGGLSLDLFGHEITTFKQREQKLTTQLQHYKALHEHAFDVITLLDKNGKILYESPSIQRVLEYSPEELIGRNSFDYVHPEDKPRAQRLLEKFSSRPGVILPVSIRLKHRNGSWRSFEALATNQLHEPHLQAWVLSSRETTERRSYQEALSESEDRFKSLADSAPALIWMTNADGSNAFINKAWREFRGGAIVGAEDPNWEQAIHPDDFAHCEQVYRNATEKREPYEVEYRLQHAEGTYHWLLERGQPRFALDGSFHGYIGLCIDITDRKQAEQVKQAQSSWIRAICEFAATSLASFDEQIRAALQLGCDWFELSYGALLPFDGSDFRLELLAQGNIDLPEKIEPVLKAYCNLAYRQAEPLLSQYSRQDSIQLGVDEETIEAFMGLTLQVSGHPYGILAFFGPKPRLSSYRSDEIDGFQLLARWIATILERRIAEEALKESRQFFETVADTSPGVISVFDMNSGRNLYVNKTTERILGYPISVVSGPASMPAAELVHPEDREKYNDYHRRCLVAKDGEILEVTLRWRHADGSYRWLMSRDIVFRRNPDGTPALFAGTAQDISERMSAHQALEEQREFFYQVININPNLIFVKDREGRYTLANRAIAELMLTTVEGLTGKSDADFVIEPTELASYQKGDQEVFETGREVYVPVQGCTMPGCGTRWFSVYKCPLFGQDGSVEQVMGVAIEITERLKAEEALRESELRYRSVVSAMTEGILVVAEGGKIIDCNASAERILGLTREQILRGIPREPIWETVYEDGTPFPAEVHPSSITLRTGQRCHGVIMGIRRPDGNLRWISINSEPLFEDLHEHGRTAVVSFNDVTERKHYQEELEELNIVLEDRIRERTSLLEAANAELESFAYSVSHDLRAPLRAIHGYASILNQQREQSPDSDTDVYLDRIRDATVRMSELIDGLLRLSRVNRAEFSRRRVGISELAEQVAEICVSQSGNSEVKVHIKPGIYAHGDAALIRVVLENLFGNAIKFTGRCDTPQIEFGLRERNGTRSYFIKDNGAGFDARYSDKLFKPFERLHPSKEYPGTGIGLATVKRIIQRHGGKIWAESKPGKGATFFFTLEPDPSPDHEW